MKNNKGPLLTGFYTTTLSIFFLVTTFLFFSTLIKVFEANAASVSTAVTVGNGAPSFTVQPYEDPASSTTTPTNVGSDVTFKATASEPNSEDYYLILCSTNSVTATESGAPTCGGTQWCVSSATTAGSQATCSRTAVIGDAESNAWYAFVCDGNANNAQCSASSQGSGDSGSPFEVNHAPGFTLAGITDSTVDPGVGAVWTTTSSDTDTSGTADTVKLLVCKTTGISAGACDGGGSDTWCSSSLVASNPTCTYNVPSVSPDTDNIAAYVYIVDSHNFPATGAYQASNVPFTINNVAPTVSAVTINGGAAIDLTESSTKAVSLTATVSDNNSCYGTELTTIYGYAYRSSVAYTGCDTAGEANTNRCYPEVTCTVDGGTCTDNTDASANYTCTVNIQYYAVPTDTATQYPDDTWLSTIKAIDDDTASNNTTVGAGVEMNSLTAASITNGINYGSLAVGESNDPLNQTTTTTPTGNVGLDHEVSGAANMCTDYPTCSVGTPIGVAYEKYALASLTAYSSGSVLSTSAVETELNVAKPTTGSPTAKDTWWGILIPAGTVSGTYSGANTLTAVKGEIVSW